MTIDAVAPNIGAVGFGTKRLSGHCSVSLRVARKIDKDAGEAAGIVPPSAAESQMRIFRERD
jgi:hypothetical protein